MFICSQKEQLAIQDHTEVANGVDWFHDDGAEVDSHGVKLFKLEQIDPRANPDQFCFVWI